MSSSRHAVKFGSTEIPFTLRYEARKDLKITVSPDMHVHVEAPDGCSLDTVLAKVEGRAAWIIRRLERIRQFQPLPAQRRYVSGETHLYLGRQYRLKIQQAERAEVKLVRGYFHVLVRDPHNTVLIQRLMKQWFDMRAREVLTGRLEQVYTVLKHHGVPPPRDIVFRKMEKRWGSCTKVGKILLNTELVHVPVSCIDYILAHELCHLKHPNHSPAFYALLTQAMPDWKERKHRLERALV